jgi:hypothetical protein
MAPSKYGGAIRQTLRGGAEGVRKKDALLRYTIKIGRADSFGSRDGRVRARPIVSNSEEDVRAMPHICIWLSFCGFSMGAQQ